MSTRNKKYLPITIIVSLGLALVLALGACGTSKPTSAPAEPPPEPVTLRIGAKCGPTPYAMPFFVMMAQTGGQLDDAVLEYVPVTGPSQMVALFTNNQVDVMLGQVIQTANMFEQGEVRNLRLRSVYLWRGFYVVAGEGITGWEDLQGERVLMPDLKTGPAYLGRASMRQAGFDPETDFIIEYLPAAQTVQMMLAGQASAVVTSEPSVTILMNKSRSEGGTPLKPAPMDLYSLYESELWPAGQLPIGGLLVLQQVLDDEAQRTALEQFEAAYYEAIEFMLANPADASQLIASQLGAYCDSKLQAKPLEKALSAGRLVYDPRPAGELLPDLDAYIELILGQPVDDSLYAQP